MASNKTRNASTPVRQYASTPVRHNMVNHLEQTERTFLNRTRRLLETVFVQITGQFNMNKVSVRKCRLYLADNVVRY